MAWVTSFHNAFASSLISLLANKLTELACTEIGYFWNVNDNLMSLVTLSRIVHMKLYKLGDKELPREWKPWVQEVTRLFYDVDDIIDGIILDVRKKNHLNQQQLANGQDQECSSSMWSSVLGNFGGRRRSGWQKAVPGDFNSTANLIIEPSLQTQVVNGYPLDHRHGRKTLVVLDDVWNVHHGAWNNFVSTLVPGTILLITTRDPKVASITATIAYPLVATLVSLAMAAECREKGPEATFTALEQSDLWDLTVFRNEIFPALRFDDPCMPTEMGKFLGYLPLFPCDYFFKKDELLQLWMAEGFVTPEKWSPSKLKDAGQHFDHLLSRSILSSSKNEQKLTQFLVIPNCQLNMPILVLPYCVFDQFQNVYSNSNYLEYQGRNRSKNQFSRIKKISVDNENKTNSNSRTVER